MDATPRTPTQIRRTSGNAPALPHDWPHRYRPRTGNDAVALGDARNCDCRTAQLSLTTPLRLRAARAWRRVIRLLDARSDDPSAVQTFLACPTLEERLNGPLAP